MYPFLNEQALRDQLRKLPKQKKLALILLMCDRMMRCFERFEKETSVDIKLYRCCMSHGWRQLEHNASMVDYEQFANSCLNEAPHPDNFSHVLRSAALDAALAVGNMMAYIHDNNDDVIIDTARLALDTVSLYIAVTDSTPPFDVGSKHRLEHSLTQRELQRQAEDINFLMSLPDIMQPEVVSQVRKRAEDAYDMIILK